LKLRSLTFLFLWLSIQINAQYFQGLVAPFISNPALTGFQQNLTIDYHGILLTNGANGTYGAYQGIFAETGIPDLKSGIGIYYQRAIALYSTVDYYSLAYAYETKLSKQWHMRGGLNLVLKQGDYGAGVIGPNAFKTDLLPEGNAGLFFYNDTWYGSIALHISHGITYEYALDHFTPTRSGIGLSGGAFFDLSDDLSINPSLTILSISTYVPRLNLNYHNFILGGGAVISFQSSYISPQVTAGYQFGKFKLGYSHGFSPVSTAAYNEISLVFQPEFPFGAQDNKMIRHFRGGL
jgi:hypothetical protein